MANGTLIIGRGPDGQNVRVNAQGVGVPIGAPAKQVAYNPGTLAQQLAIRMMQQRARQRVAAGQPAQNGFTYAQTMAEWNTAQAEANEKLRQAREKYHAHNGMLVDNEFDVQSFLVDDYLRPSRGRDRVATVSSLLDTSSKDPNDWRIKGPDPLGYDYPKPQFSSPGVPQTTTPSKPVGADPFAFQKAKGEQYVDDVANNGAKALDPTLEKYKQLRADWMDAAQKGLAAEPDTGADGDFGASTDKPSTSTAMGVSKFTAFQYLLVGDGANKTVEKGPQLYSKLIAEALADPTKAGELMASMVAVGAYGGGSEKYVQDRLYLAKDKNGQAIVKGRFTVDDANALADVLPLIANDQANIADGVIARGGDVSEIPGFEELLAKRGIERQDMAGTLQPAGDSGGGGGRRGGGGGFGGGGGGGAARFTDPEQLKSLIDGIARQRLGRILTVEESQAFADYYHSQEAASGGVNYTSGGGRVLDPESQAIAWIESRYRDEGARQQQGNYVSTLLKMLQGSEFAMGGS